MTAALAAHAAQRGPRLNQPGKHRRDLASLAEEFAQLRRVHGRPRCAQERTLFEDAERTVEIVTGRRADPDTAEVTIDGHTFPATEPIKTVQAWCHTCRFKQICLQLMTSGAPPYTGIAGGEILHRSRPYRTRTETQCQRAGAGAGE